MPLARSAARGSPQPRPPLHPGATAAVRHKAAILPAGHGAAAGQQASVRGGGGDFLLREYVWGARGAVCGAADYAAGGAVVSGLEVEVEVEGVEEVGF